MNDVDEQAPTVKVPAMKQLRELKVTIPIGILGVIATMVWKADEITVEYLSQWFVTKAEAQTTTQKLTDLEGKVDDLSSKIDGQRVRQLESEIFDLRVKQCMETGALKTVLQSQIAKHVGEWRALTGSGGDPPTLVRCEDLG